ncbi:TetR/AcrR family transcriptional regulator [Kribbella italica]|uniref:AcrR family transcriptional regulator n=1 Tax=Kribbella italica TaxID=1540520 RepID=A0A7W9MXW5_9ACTN|nr:TetR/AcrR family transcriptional regulator [Kribbella italica]MBB5839805.1 AcrR family transcriptional regulator [Kribbella italica]
MSPVNERRERERADRHRLIVTAARELAEAEGWEAVTTRRLADRVEYSQPVLYSHFNGMTGIVSAVALEGFEALAAQLRGAREEATGQAREEATGQAREEATGQAREEATGQPQEGVTGPPVAGKSGKASPLGAVCQAYLDFASTRPAVYQAMFVLPTELKFASDETPASMRACFDEFVACFRGDDEPRELSAEVVWSAVHGMAVLSGSGRIPPALQEERVGFLVSRLAE